MNSLDLNAEELNTNDPAIINASNNNFYVDGNVGVVYAHSGFKFGFAFTELFSSNSFNHDSFNKFAFSNLKNRLYSVSYRFNVGIMQNFAVEPYLLYRQSADGLQAIQWWRAGEEQKVIDYCLQDVKVTRDIFTHGRANGTVQIQHADGNKVSVPVQWN